MSNNRFIKIFWTGFAIACPVIPVFFYFAGNWYSIFHSYSVGMVFGIISYIYFLNTLIISSRIRYFDSIFGHDRVLVFHGYLALAAISAAIAHYCTKSISGFDLSIQSGFGVFAFYLFATIIVVTLLFMVDMVPGKPVKNLRNFAANTLRFDYAKLKLFHNFAFLAIIFIALHVLFATSTQEKLVRILVMGIWGAASISFYIYHKFIRTTFNNRKGLTVVDVSNLAPEIIEIRMRYNNGKVYNYRAGQFGYFRMMSSLLSKEEHPFTISSQPGSDGLTITVKILGDYTATLKNLPVGTNVIYDGPYGVFTPEQNAQHHIFIAGGIGITPFLSIISEWNFKGITDPITLIWSAKSSDEMIHHEFFERIESKNSNFLFVPVISRPIPNKTDGKHIDKILLESIVKKKELKNTVVYICGPQTLRTRVIKDFKMIGIPSGNIHYEKFSF